MINEYIRYRIDAVDVDDFLAAYTRAGESLRASPHCLGYEMSRCTEAPDHFILRIHWDSAEGHMQGFRSSPQFQAFLREIRPYVKNIEEMRHYELTGFSWSR
jgi:quinol monooxygenase YgiN